MTIAPLPLVALGATLCLVMMTTLWFVQRRSGDAGIVDVGWAAGLGLLAVLYATLSDGDPLRRLVLAVIAGGWSFRLAAYLYSNRIHTGEEDGRYQQLREDWGEQTQRNLFVFFLAQGALDVVLSLSFLVVATNATPLGLPAAVAILVGIVAVTGESIADGQLARFRADPANRGRTCRQGLWRYSRHPNYFFEWIHWWAYVPLAVGSAWWPATLVAPALMLFFILKVTGIPPTEERALLSRGDDYRDYQRTTSAFFPWFPRRSS